MTNQEWLELFFSESYERQINELILEDWDYEIPHDSILNYVRHLLEIPYKEFLGVVESETYIDNYSLPQLIINDDDLLTLIDYFIEEDNRGILSAEIGRLIGNKHDNNICNISTYGNKILNVACIIGLVYEYYGSWYLNCTSYVLDLLTIDELHSVLSRMVLRNKAIASIVCNLRNCSPYFSSMFLDPREYWIVRFLNGVCYLLSICRKEARKEGIKISYLKDDPCLKSSNGRKKIIKQGTFVCRYKDLFSGLNDDDIFDDSLNYILSMKGFINSVQRDLEELELCRGEIYEECQSPSFRKGEKLKKQLIVYTDFIGVSYISYDSSWRENDSKENYNPAMNEDFLRRLLPHQMRLNMPHKADDINQQKNSSSFEKTQTNFIRDKIDENIKSNNTLTNNLSKNSVDATKPVLKESKINESIIDKSSSVDSLCQLSLSTHGLRFENKSNHCYLYNSDGAVVFSGLGYILNINGILYRAIITFRQLKITTVSINNELNIPRLNYFLIVDHSTQLYQTFIKYMPNCISRLDIENKRLQINGQAFDFNGAMLKDNE